MAGNKMNTKTKGKDEKGKGNKGLNQTNEDCEDVIDFAVLRKPIPTSITGFAQARKIFDLATEELKDLLSNECDLLYECKVCRNIFRSLANFISHKRVYCKDKFSSTIHGHFVNSNSTENEMMKIKRAEENYKEFLKTKTSNDGKETVEDERIPFTKDLTAVYEKIIQNKGVLANESPQVLLKRIPNSSVAVFQNRSFEDKAVDNMRAEVQELDTILSRKKAVLQSDGKFIIEESNEPEKSDSGHVIQISDDEDDNDDTDALKCKICDLQFSTQKTLKFHMKYKHLESRLVYPCPDCLEIFSTSWSVYRHLFKVHRKTAAQIRRLRESIQAKAFRMNNPPAFYEKRKNMKVAPPQQFTEEERRDQENQAWMDNMEGDGEVPRCGGCGRTFERRAALAAHTHTCQPRSRALARAPPRLDRPDRPDRPDAKRIEIQIRKDYNKGPPQQQHNNTAEKGDKVINEIKGTICDTQNENDKEEVDKEIDEGPMEVEDDEKSNDSANSPEKSIENKLEDDIKPIIRLPYALQAEKSNLAAFKQRVSTDIDLANHQCKKCDTKLTSALELYAHMADHVKWMRYACKLCNFKHYDFEKLPEHVKIVHKLKGDTDFYYSTVKAIDGKEAMIISTCLAEPEASEDGNDPNETSPESRRPSRCSSDSSRLSDDSSSSSNLKETSNRKRKMQQNRSTAKKKKEINDDGEDQNAEEKDKVVKTLLGDSNNSPSLKAFEENSSDMDDIEDKISKRSNLYDSLQQSRRPVRKRTKVKNADFEYDLSNLLKMEAQGYRESQSTTTTTTAKAAPVAPKLYQVKKKVQSDPLSNFATINQDCLGALYTLSKKAVETAAAHMRTSCFAIYSVSKPNVFARPMLPRILARSEKASPKKDNIEETKDNANQNKICKIAETLSLKNTETLSLQTAETNSKNATNKDIVTSKTENEADASETEKTTKINKEVENDNNNETVAVTPNGTESIPSENVNSGNLNIPAVVPIKFRRQSLELMRNHPIINKNITDFSKAGMKTKILVIKPIHRNNDGNRPANAPLKFQTIKLKDPSKGSSSEDMASDQVMVVKVPKVPCTSVSNVSDKTDLPPLEVNLVSKPKDNESIEKKCQGNEVKSGNDDKSETKEKQEPVSNEESKECKSNETVTAALEPVSDSLVGESANSNDAVNPKSVEVEAM